MQSAPAITFPYVLIGKRVWISHRDGYLGSALALRLQAEQAEVVAGSILPALAAADFFNGETINAVIVIADPSNPDHALSIINAALESGVEKLMFVAPADVYPNDVLQPVMEIFLQTDPAPETLSANAKAALAAIKRCSDVRRDDGADFFSAIHAELYGPGVLNGDHGTPSVISQLIDKAQRDGLVGLHDEISQSNRTTRHELLHHDDAADALVHLLQTYTGEMHINVGAGFDISSIELADVIADIGRLARNNELSQRAERATTQSRNLLNSRRLAATGWRPRIGLREGIAETWGWHLAHSDTKTEDHRLSSKIKLH
jgi:GDP-L-fucose synthase